MPRLNEKDSDLFARYLPWAVSSVVAVTILGATVFWSSRYVRANGREPIIGRHAQIVYQLWLNQKFTEQVEGSGSNEEAVDQLPAVLETVRLPQLAGICLGTRVFNTNGSFLFGDPNVTESTLQPDLLVQLRQLKPLARLRAAADLSEVSVAVSEESPSTGPVLEVYIPLHVPGHRQLLGAAQFLFDGKDIVAELRKLDRTLLIQSSATFLAGGGLLVLVLGLGFRQHQRMHQLLLERSRDLLRANQELALAAKSSAVGAVTAHLIHGLKNPLSGLQTFVASRGTGVQDAEESEWQLAVNSTRRMQNMISEIVRVLRDEDIQSEYELSLEELSQMLGAKVLPLAREAGVEFAIQVSAEGTLRNREANLISLILYNLVHNALQATPAGKSVILSFGRAGEAILFSVRDQGPGISAAQQANLFKPCRSSKEGGSGIGLAISKQLANCLGAELSLKESGPGGSLFVLEFAPGHAVPDASLASQKVAR